MLIAYYLKIESATGNVLSSLSWIFCKPYAQGEMKHRVGSLFLHFMSRWFTCSYLFHSESHILNRFLNSIFMCIRIINTHIMYIVRTFFSFTQFLLTGIGFQVQMNQLLNQLMGIINRNIITPTIYPRVNSLQSSIQIRCNYCSLL